MQRLPGLPIGIIAVIFTVAIANLGNNIVAPVMPSIRNYFGSSAAEVGLVASGFGIGRMLMDLPAGYLSDRITPARLFTAGILVTGAASALAAYSGTLQELIFWRMIMGCGAATMSTVALVLLVNIARPEQRGQVLSYYTSALLFSQGVAPTIGGYLANAFDWRAAFIFCALTPLISLPVNLLGVSRAGAARSWGKGVETSPHGREPSRAGAPRRAAPPSTNWWALGAVYLGTFANFFDRQGMRQAMLPLYGGLVLGMDPGTIGAILTVGSMATIFICLPGGAIADRIGRKVLLVPGLAVMAVGNLALLLGDNQLIFVVATVLISMGVLANNMQSGLVADLIPERLVGKGVGLYRLTADVGMVVGPFIMGLLLDAFGFTAASMAGAAVILLGVIAAVVWVPRRTMVLAGTRT